MVNGFLRAKDGIVEHVVECGVMDMLENEREVFRSYDILECLDYKEKREREGYRVYIYPDVDTLGRYKVTEKPDKNCKRRLQK